MTSVTRTAHHPNMQNSYAKSEHTRAIVEASNALSTASIIAAAFISSSRVVNAEESDINIISREDVGFIDLNQTEPKITDVAWLDIQIGDSKPQRLEISLYGDVTPIAASNFKSLCSNKGRFGYKNSDIFRIISTFSIQGGNIILPTDLEKYDGEFANVPQSKIQNFGHSADDIPFAPENYKILHSYKDAGVISMMKDIKNRNMQDSRFFITTRPYASWADGKYVAFGRVSKGFDFLIGLTLLPVEPPSNYPKTSVKIFDSGVY